LTTLNCKFETGMTNDIFHIRQANNNDTLQIIRLVKSILPEFDLIYSPDTSEKDLANIEETYTKSGGAFIVMVNEKDEIIGTVAVLRLDNQKCKLRKMYVSSKYRGLKLGEKLLENALEKVAELNFKTVYLETVHSMSAAIHLYKKFGFEIEETSTALSPRCDIVMKKEI